MEQKTIQNEAIDIFNQFAQTVSTSQPAAPTEQSVEAPPVAPVEAATESPKEATPVATPVAPAATPAESGLFEDWAQESATPSAPAQTATPAPSNDFDFSTIAKELGVESVKTKDDFLSLVKEAKAKADLVSKAPEDLVKAIEIYNNNGDYLEYLNLSVVDWSKEDPVILYENYVENQFFDPKTGSIDYEKADAILDRMDDAQKEFQGRELQRQYMLAQANRKAAIAAEAAAKKAAFESQVRQAINSTNDIYGFVLTPQIKSDLLNTILAGEDLKDPDINSRVMTAFLKKHFSSISKYMKTKIQNSTKREMIEQATFPQVTSASSPVSVAPSSAYSLDDFLKEIKTQKGP